MQFRDRHVVVTGGMGALGGAVVEALVAAGATCHIPLRENKSASPARPNVKLYAGVELSDEAAVARLFAAIERPWASIHIAGGLSAATVSETSGRDAAQQMETNFMSAFLCCHFAVRAMMQAGGGRIVNVAARPALEWRAGSGMVAYTASKAAVAALTVALAEEVARHGILVNAVAPSIMDTPANRNAMPKAKFDDWPKVGEVANTIVFLASPDNKVTRGAIVPVYGRA